jgi:hypothetical protein
MLKKHQSNTCFSAAKAFLAACPVWGIEIDQSRKYQKEKRFGGGEALLLWLLLTAGLHLLSPYVSACRQWLYEYRFDKPDRQVLQSTPSLSSQKAVEKTTNRRGVSRKRSGLK